MAINLFVFSNISIFKEILAYLCRMKIERFALNPADSLAGVFGLTGRTSPYETSLRGNVRAPRL